MRWILVFSLCTFAATAQAQENPAEHNSVGPVVPGYVASPSDLSMGDPEIWLYLHEQRRQDDPKMAVRRKAERRAAERMARIAAMKWYGYSNSRPRAEVTPFMSFYSPHWDGNGMNQGRWYPQNGRVQVNYLLNR